MHKAHLWTVLSSPWVQWRGERHLVPTCLLKAPTGPTEHGSPVLSSLHAAPESHGVEGRGCPVRGPDSQLSQTSAGVGPWGPQGLRGEKENVSGTGEKVLLAGMRGM